MKFTVTIDRDETGVWVAIAHRISFFQWRHAEGVAWGRET